MGTAVVAAAKEAIAAYDKYQALRQAEIEERLQRTKAQKQKKR